MRRLLKLRLWFLGIVNALILLHIILYYAFDRTSVGCIDFFGLATVAGKGVVTSGTVFLLILVLGTLVLGRAFCGWGCHFAFFQDGLTRLAHRVGLRVPFRRSRLEYVLPPILFAVTLLYPIVAWWRENGVPRAVHTDLAYPDLWHLLPGFKGVVLILVIDVVALTLLFGSRAFCRYVCPYGLFLKFFHALSPVRVVKRSACSDCGACAGSCPTGVPIKYEVEKFGAILDLNCMNCGDCVASCPDGALVIRPTKLAYARGLLPRLRFTPQGWWVDVLLAGFAIAGLVVYRGREFGDFLSVGLGLLVGAVTVSAVQPRWFSRSGYIGRLRIHRPLILIMSLYFVLGMVGQALSLRVLHAADRALSRSDYESLANHYGLGRRIFDATEPAVFFLDDFEDRARDRVPQLQQAADAAMSRQAWRNAELLCRAMIDADHGQIGAYGNLGTALFRQGRYWEAARSYHAVLNYDPNDLVALYHLAMVRIELGQKDEAVEIVTKILSIDNVGNAYRLIRENPLFELLEDKQSYKRVMSLYELRNES